MATDPAAERWFLGKPAEPILRGVREVTLGADKRMAEGTKYGTVMFHCGADVAEVDARRAELSKIVVASCDLMSAPKGKKKA